MNEAETRAELIDPALRNAGWGVVQDSRVRREEITLGRLEGNGRRGKQDIADYVLYYKGQKLGVIEAKRRDLGDTEGVQQAKRYAAMLQARFAYSTNGRRIYQIDMQTGKETYVDQYPSPEKMWEMVHGKTYDWMDRFGEVPFEDKGGQWQARYYQHNAINKTLESISAGKNRILLNLATGTGKTFIAFQLSWKLFQSKWNVSGEPTRRPRILFLADRNILANQAFNSFSSFDEDALVRISPKEIRKKGRVPKNGSIFFTIFQTFMTGTDEDGEPTPYFGEYAPDFFDFIIVDECHRGGAKDESTWRAILEYFSPAVQLGLTATPKRDENADTYAYFGRPVYTYALKDGINDGFLTPFRVKQIATTIDEYTYTDDDLVVQGDVEVGQTFTEGEINRRVEIEARERYRVETFMNDIDQNQKTIVFCATQDHARLVRDIINQVKTSKHPDYCVRVTAEDGAQGEQFLEKFQDNEKTIPTILTTSQKLSTGVDARNVRNIILMRPVNSMIEFKQIVGRGTRLFDGKDYFTIYDFVEAYKHFQDPEWDGEPLDPDPCKKCGVTPCVCEKTKEPKECAICGQIKCECKLGGGACDECDADPCICEGRQKVIIKLADGKERLIQKMEATTFWDASGKPMSAAEFIKRLFGEIPELFKDEDELRKLWGEPETRSKLLEALSERGYDEDKLKEIGKLIQADKGDLFDVLAYIAYTKPPITRAERVTNRRDKILSTYDDKLAAFIEFVLGQYVDQGVSELNPDKLKKLIELKYYGINEAIQELGDANKIRDAFVGFQKELY